VSRSRIVTVAVPPVVLGDRRGPAARDRAVVWPTRALFPRARADTSSPPIPDPSLVLELVRYIPVIALAGLVIAFVVYWRMTRDPAGEERARSIGRLIETGAMAFLKRQYIVLLPVLVLVACLLWLTLDKAISATVAGAFVFGGICSLLAGLFGMKAATKANIRTTEAARQRSRSRALAIAFNGGAVMGLAVSSLGLLGLGLITIWYLNLTAPAANDARTLVMFAEIVSGFAMGASSIALFARVGGGIYTKAADVGADLVGKVEAGIPEDDPRNPATIADNVGDNVGDVAGMGADIYESNVDAIVAAIAIAATGPIAAASRMNAIALPLGLAVAGLAASLLAMLAMRVLARGSPAAALRWVAFVAAGLFLLGAWFLVGQLPIAPLAGRAQLQPFVAILAGTIAGILIGWIT
jgi:K(+)-stimulated pyrophosphate-energized sodium pump